MKLTFEWLNDYLDLSGISGNELAERMSRTGIEIESVENFADQISGLVVGHVLECTSHPESDHLNICQVDLGNGDVQQIICGAPNIAAGQKVMVAKVGALLPNNFQIQTTELRGCASNGMICSLQEIGFSDNVVPKKYAKGIYVLPEDAPVGESIVDYLKLNDEILELDLTPNRSDALSIEGCVYEVAAILNQAPQHWPVADNESMTNDFMSIQIEDTELSPYFTLRLIKGITVTESPLWLQVRLMKLGIRPTNNVVDLTNYLMLLFGQPMHAYDYDKLCSQTMGVRLAKDGEKLVTLDDVERVLDSQDIVITDGDKVIGLAGVMGGLETEVTETTQNILIESAMFDGTRIRKTSKKFGLRSEASLRNEKGLDYQNVKLAGQHFSKLLSTILNVTFEDNLVEYHALTMTQPKITVKYQTIYDKLGIQINLEELKEIFARLNFDVDYHQDDFTVTIPSRRRDIHIEADVLEEVARIYGYDTIPATLPTTAGTPGMLTKSQLFIKKTRDIFEGMGLDQIISYILTSEDKAKLICTDEDKLVKLALPMSEDRTTLRQSMFPALLEVAQFNFARQAKSMAIYEIGRVFVGQGAKTQPIEQERLSIMISGIKEDNSWYGSEVTYDFYDLKGMFESYLSMIRLDDQIEFVVNSKETVMHPGRTADIKYQNQIIGLMGQVHPTVCETYDLPENTYFIEIELEPLIQSDKEMIKQTPINKYPSSSRDVAILLPTTVAHADIVTIIKNNGGSYLKSIQLFDVYQGDKIEDGKQSLAYRLVFQNENETITEKDITEAMEQIHSVLLEIDQLEIR